VADDDDAIDESELNAAESEPIAKLTAAMAAGDEAAVEAFYRLYFDRLFAEARHVVRGRDEAFYLDVVQDAVLRIIRTVRRVKSKAQFHAWLRLVVRTTALDRLRGERRRARRELAVAGTVSWISSAAATSGADEIDDDGSQYEWLRRQIDSLDPQIVRMIELRFERSWTLARIGKLLGLSTGTIDGRLRRALRLLKDRAREEFDSDE
jgi:RNA polymerase sigma-70 factor (ECF subfamily)